MDRLRGSLFPVYVTRAVFRKHSAVSTRIAQSTARIRNLDRGLEAGQVRLICHYQESAQRKQREAMRRKACPSQPQSQKHHLTH